MAITDSNQIIEKFMGANEQSLKEYFSSFLETRHRRPCLVVMTVGDDQRAKEAASRKVLLGGRVGVDVVVRSFPETVKMHDFRSDLRQMAKDRQVDGVYLQMPMPGRINVPLLTEEIAVAKDVGGYGALSDCYPCAPLAFLLLLSSLGIRLEGKNALIAGRGQAIAEPMSQMLLAKGCTVHVCHESTEEADLKDAASKADVIVSAVGEDGFLGKGLPYKPSAVAIDAGTLEGGSGDMAPGLPVLLQVNGRDFEDLGVMLNLRIAIAGGK